MGPNDAVIIISHRGTKTYSFLALELAKAQGAYTVTISSTDPGPRLQVADAAIHTVAQERSAAFTISYTAALTVLARLATAVG
ncbi:SIS domain-containing protein, partial [Vibrio parahaemolyticus]|uniref:SIS domain-containing protein n=1 Tax=Vibrio parahaemolyticus TaxID=670 RepID=UPI0034E01C58